MKNKSIINGLRDLEDLGKEGVWYVVFGSLIPAALNRAPHRSINDIDVLALAGDVEKIREFLRERGYEGDFVSPPRRLGFQWLELHKGDIEIAICFGGLEKNGGWRMPLKYGFSAYLSLDTLGPRQYILDGVCFPGLPPETAYLILSIFSQIYSHPKRRDDLVPFQGNLDQHLLEKIRNSNTGVWFLRLSLPTEKIITLGARMRNIVSRKNER